MAGLLSLFRKVPPAEPVTLTPEILKNLEQIEQGSIDQQVFISLGMEFMKVATPPEQQQAIFTRLAETLKKDPQNHRLWLRLAFFAHAGARMDIAKSFAVSAFNKGKETLPPEELVQAHGIFSDARMRSIGHHYDDFLVNPLIVAGEECGVEYLIP